MTASPERPPEVTLAVTLVGASLVVGGLDLILQYAGLSSPQSEASSLLGLIFGAAVTSVFLWLILRRHNWARITFAILTLVTVVTSIPILLNELSGDVVGAVLTVTQIALQLVAVWLLFRPLANAWFKAE